MTFPYLLSGRSNAPEEASQQAKQQGAREGEIFFGRRGASSAHAFSPAGSSPLDCSVPGDTMLTIAFCQVNTLYEMTINELKGGLSAQLEDERFRWQERAAREDELAQEQVGCICHGLY
jgi:hypothetical protein